MLVSLISKIGGQAVNQATVEKIVDGLVAVGHAHGLNTAMYQAGAQPGGISGRRLSGHMLQIFVRKEDADSLAYASRPMGVPLQSFQSIREYAGQVPCKGQDPDMFTVSDRVRSFHYCSWAQLCSDIVARGARCIESFVGCSKIF